MRSTILIAILVAGLPIGARVLLAHHSFAPHFDRNRPVSITGTIVRYEARNPHSYLHIAAVDENGRTQEYVCESHGFTQLRRIGLTPELLRAGTRLTVTGSASKHSAYMCFFDSVELEDGRTLSVNAPSAPGASGRPAGARRTEIFGTWLLAPMPNRSTSGPQPMMESLTPAGERAVAAYDPFRDDPTFRCDPVAVRRVWGAPSTPLEIVRRGGDVVLRHEWMDVERVVHMGMDTHPPDGTFGSLGHSIGRFEGDTLVIETAYYAGGVLSQYVEEAGQPTKGLLHSAALTTVERLRVDAERQRLVVEIDHADPEFFTRPFSTVTREFSPSNLSLEPFDCSREGPTGLIRE